MQQLPSNCRAGKFSVYPTNWKTVKANKDLIWRITYWFYDDNINQKKQIVIKGMNMASTLKEKQALVALAMDDELHEIGDKGFNPITKTYSTPVDNEINEFTPFVDALDYAFNNINALTNTKIDIRSCLKYITASIKYLHYDRLSIGQVKRKHVKFVLEQCGKMKERWSGNLYNHYRKYLSVLFKQLVEVDAVDVNPVREISKRPQLKKIRETLTHDQRKLVNDYTRKNHYAFWRFLQIFFHSGARITELLQVKKKDVDLINQKYKIIARKGRKYQEEYRTIKTIAVPFWEDILSNANSNQYLFSIGLVPGDKSIRPDQITHRWKKYIKDKLGITADLYSLKHLNLDEIAGSSGMQAAQEMAGHSTPVVTMIYTQGEKERKHNRLKNINNPF